MPALGAEALAGLEVDIAERGIIVPVVVDQHGRVLDGHHRRAIAERLGITCPTEVREVADDEDARQTALALNLARRHLSREERRELIAAECAARPGDSDREIARRLGCSPSTVGAVRRPVSNLDTPTEGEQMTAAEAREVTRSIRSYLLQLNEHVSDALGNGLPPAHVLASIVDVLSKTAGPPEVQVAVRSAMQPLVDDLTALVLNDSFPKRAEVADDAEDRFREACRS
jgi:transposase-like protein